MRFATELLHGPLDRDAATGAVSPPIYQTSTFAQPSFDHFGKYDYSRSGNPTRDWRMPSPVWRGGATALPLPPAWPPSARP
jgi:cystathionine beta-lyase/cystathionine gamma-synthase